jgi:tRNA (guanine-N7-)-methyltransferase
MRKVARLLRRDEACAAIARVMVPCGDHYFTVEPTKLFGREAPLELEIGSGRGDFMIERAATMPDRDFMAVELAGQISSVMAARAGLHGFRNLRVLRMDARPLVNLMLAARTVSACHIYFPDPWPKERHVKHRLFTPIFVGSLRRILRPDARLYVATDVRAYADRIFAMLTDAGFRRISEPAPGATITGFALKFIGEGRELFAGTWIPPAVRR